jgi:hypothetical protein
MRNKYTESILIAKSICLYVYLTQVTHNLQVAVRILTASERNKHLRSHLG